MTLDENRSCDAARYNATSIQIQRQEILMPSLLKCPMLQCRPNKVLCHRTQNSECPLFLAIKAIATIMVKTGVALQQRIWGSKVIWTCHLCLRRLRSFSSCWRTALTAPTEKRPTRGGLEVPDAPTGTPVDGSRAKEQS